MAVAAVAVIGAAAASSSSRKATKEQAKGQRRALGAQQDVFQQTQRQSAPWRKVGRQALGSLADIYGLEADIPGYQRGAPGEAFDKFQESPGYQFQLQEALKASERRGAAGGLTGGGAQLQELQRVAQGQASGEWGNYVAGLRNLAGLGGQFTQQGIQQGIQQGANIGNLYQQQGYTAASGTMQQANILGQGIGDVMQAYGQQPQQPQQTATPSAGGSASDYSSPAYQQWASQQREFA